jgi:hypothetical protein
LASTLTPHPEIAKVVKNPKSGKHISATTLERHFKHELANGRAQVRAYAVGKLFKLIQAEHPASIMFYLKTQCGWRETSVHEVGGLRGGPIQANVTGRVEVVLPSNGRRNDQRSPA